MEKPVEVPETTEAPLELILEAPTPGPSALARTRARSWVLNIGRVWGQ